MTIKGRCYAGIGSRETPEYICQIMRGIGVALFRRGFTLRTGGAEGADSAFEAGAREAGAQIERGLELYLPWKRFNGRKEWTLATADEEAFLMASRFHPKWSQLKWSVKQLIARNTYQVLGRNLDHPVDFVACWTPKASGSGGTGQAIRIANSLGIPVFDLYDDGARHDLLYWINEDRTNALPQLSERQPATQ